jgi:Plasmid pRiA4b ORF-3-like protein
MKRRQKSPGPEEKASAPTADADAILQVKVWLVGISPMVWRRVPVPTSFTLRELHGVIQVAMGWEGIHLYDFHLRAARYGSWEVAASSPDVTLAALRFRKGARFIYEYDLNIPWRHEVRIEDRLELEARKTYPVCTGGDGACPPEDCGGPASFMDHRDDRFSFDALEDLDTMVEVLQQIALKDGSEVLALDQDTRWRLEDALERAKAREQAQGRPFSRRDVNASLRDGEHLNLMHQQW